MCFIHSQALFKRTSRSEKTTLELHRYSPSPCGVSMDSGVRRHDAARREFSPHSGEHPYICVHGPGIKRHQVCASPWPRMEWQNDLLISGGVFERRGSE
jgi:hypothetical protein